MAAASVFIIITTHFSGEAGVLLALIVVMLGWRSIGGWLQSVVTTRTPNEKQLKNGIAAGEQLLERYQDRPNYQVTGLNRVWSMGFLQTACGMVAMVGLLELLEKLFPVLKILG